MGCRRRRRTGVSRWLERIGPRRRSAFGVTRSVRGCCDGTSLRRDLMAERRRVARRMCMMWSRRVIGCGRHQARWRPGRILGIAAMPRLLLLRRRRRRRRIAIRRRSVRWPMWRRQRRSRAVRGTEPHRRAVTIPVRTVVRPRVVDGLSLRAVVMRQIDRGSLALRWRVVRGKAPCASRGAVVGQDISGRVKGVRSRIHSDDRGIRPAVIFWPHHGGERSLPATRAFSAPLGRWKEGEEGGGGGGGGGGGSGQVSQYRPWLLPDPEPDALVSKGSRQKSRFGHAREGLGAEDCAGSATARLGRRDDSMTCWPVP